MASTSKAEYPSMALAQAQRDFPQLCRQGKGFLITEAERPLAILLPIAEYEAILETMALLSNPRAMTVLRAAKAGKLAYRPLDLDDENFGL
jgi:PHD/YefM family antitoxin component YafN of YafNO toxin-antitoxin module